MFAFIVELSANISLSRWLFHLQEFYSSQPFQWTPGYDIQTRHTYCLLIHHSQPPSHFMWRCVQPFQPHVTCSPLEVDCSLFNKVFLWKNFSYHFHKNEPTNGLHPEPVQSSSHFGTYLFNNYFHVTLPCVPFYPQEFSINTLCGCLVPYEQDIQVACYIYLDLILMTIQCHQKLYQQINKLKFSLLVEFRSWDIAETKGKWGS